jgi:Serine/threonine protein kinase
MRNYIVLEHAENGELFDFIEKSGRFPEPLARHFFRELICALNHCHSKGVTHRDLKTENLLLDHNYTLKLIDFGSAGPVSGKHGSPGKLKTKIGTLGYMAPELHERKEYNGKEVDIFAAACILFIMVAEHPPFTTSERSDPYYKCLRKNKPDVFWNMHTKVMDNGFSFSEEFKDLVEKML